MTWKKFQWLASLYVPKVRTLHSQTSALRHDPRPEPLRGKAARMNLYGGLGEIYVPTATASRAAISIVIDIEALSRPTQPWLPVSPLRIGRKAFALPSVPRPLASKRERIRGK